MERSQKRDGRAVAAVVLGVEFPGGHEVCLSEIRAALRGAKELARQGGDLRGGVWGLAW